MSKSGDDYIGMLLEQIRGEIKTIHELVAGQPTRDEFNGLRQDVAELKDDVKVVKAAVTDVSGQVNDHEQRITNVEATVRA